MKRETWSIIGACALGAFIGAFVALDIASRFQYGSYFWSAGALIGGVVAYVAVDFRQFCSGVARSYHRTIAWRPYYLYWRALFANWLGICAMAATAVAAVGVPCVITSDGATIPTPVDWLYALYGFGVFFVLIWSILCLTLAPLVVFGGLIGRRRYDSDAEYEDYLRHEIADGYRMARDTNPFGVMYHLLKGLRWLVLHSPSLSVQIASFITGVAVLLAQFVAGVFISVHSERRTLCFVDASLGAAIGYAFGSAVIGTVVGVFLGVISYELVSVRWLKLAPRTTE